MSTITDEQIMDAARPFAEDGGRWPSDWIGACRAVLALQARQVPAMTTEQMRRDFEAWFFDPSKADNSKRYQLTVEDMRRAVGDISWKAWQAAIASQAQLQGDAGKLVPSWMPIETAPKDGTDILLYGTWAGEIHGIAEAPTMDIGHWAGGKSDYQGDEWWSLATGDAYACWMRPTHWMPLPAAPVNGIGPEQEGAV
jgi:hypothetical protein